MRIFAKIFYGFITVCFILIFIFITLEELFAPKYYTTVVSSKLLTQKEKHSIKKLISIKSNEQFMFFYGKGYSIEDGGIVLTNLRVVEYYPNYEKKKIKTIKINNIKNIALIDKKNFFQESVIKITRKDNTKLSLTLLKKKSGANKLYQTLKKIKKNKL